MARVPTAVPDVPGPAAQVVCGEDFMAVLLRDGRIATCGDDDATLRVLDGVAGAVCVADGYSAERGCAVTLSDGRVLSWGAAPHGHGHDGDVAEPVEVAALRGAVCVSRGARGFAALLGDGTVLAACERYGNMLGRAEGEHAYMRAVAST